MTVASGDTETGGSVQISCHTIPQALPFPSYSPLHDRFPAGLSLLRWIPHAERDLHLCVRTSRSLSRGRYPAPATRGRRRGNRAHDQLLGADRPQGFESLVNSVGGINMDVYRRVPIGGGSTEDPRLREAGKNRHLNGYEAPWFARSRADSSDYDRMVRQKCVMSAMLNQFDPITVLTKFNKIAAASRQAVATDIPTSEIGAMIDLALKAKRLPVSSVAMTPLLINPNSPDFTLVGHTVQKRIAASEAIDRPVAQPTPASTPSASAKPKPTASPSRDAQTNDLGKACSA